MLAAWTIATEIWNAGDSGALAQSSLASLVLVALSAVLTWAVVLRRTVANARDDDAGRVRAKEGRSEHSVSNLERTICIVTFRHPLDDAGHVEPRHDGPPHELVGAFVQTPPNAAVGIVDRESVDTDDGGVQWKAGSGVDPDERRLIANVVPTSCHSRLECDQSQLFHPTRPANGDALSRCSGWRHRRLLAHAWLGGFPGAKLGQHFFRHKVTKQPFARRLNRVGWTWAVLGGGLAGYGVVAGFVPWP